ncbi:hypothetical protein BU17DRAFT_71814 [Hysterangium stoloniferum]|nr:hypothetical protein BU17DRAFT_71814 [Hysterangium stoloniferum]
MAKQPDFDTELEEARAMNESQLALLDKANAKKGHFSQIMNTAVEASKVSDDSADDLQASISTIWPSIKDQLRDFSACSDYLLPILDELTELHPFIRVTVLPFKAAIKLFMTRQENDQKVTIIYYTMNETMLTLKFLKYVKGDRGGMTIENRIRARMQTIKKSILDSMQLCHRYTKQHTAIKLLTSPKWRRKFREVTDEFAENKEGLLKDIQLHASINIASIQTTTATIEGSIFGLTKMIFVLSRSQEERGMDEFIKKNGGLDAEQLRVEVEDIIKENSEAFQQQYELLRIQIDKVQGVVKRDSDRTISAIREGPHDRIPKRQSSVNEKKEINVINQIREIVDPSNVKPAERKVEEIASVANKSTTIRPEDEWALGYINVFRVQPLMETLDRDASSFVTVVEANAFTADRPPQWTLPHWLVYWTYGFELSVNWYRAHIIKLLAHISSAVNKTLPANRVTVEYFWQSNSFFFIDSLLAGFYDGDIQDDIDIENDAQFLKFKDYILKQEASLCNMLSKVTYNLGEYDTLSIVLGPSRLETCILPLLRLLLQRALDILRISETVVLNDAELSIIDDSIYNLNFATHKRVNTLKELKDISKLQYFDFKTQTRKFFFGVYYYYWEEAIVNGYWKLSPDTNSVLGSLAEGGLPSEESGYENAIDDLSNSLDGSQSTAAQNVTIPTTESHDRPLDSTENDNAVRSDTLEDLTHILSNEPIGSPPQNKPALFFGPSSEDSITADNGSSDQTEPQPSDISISNDPTHALLGQNPVRLMSFSVTSGYTDGKFSGAGVDGMGEFLVEGSLGTDGVKLIKTYVYSMQDEKVIEEYRGTLSASMESMSGSCGPQRDNQPAGPITADSKSTTNDPPAPETTDDKTPFQDSTALDGFRRGGFVLKRRHLFWLSDPELEARQARRLSWLEDEDLVEWANFHKKTPPEYLRLWNAMAAFYQRRRILHSSLFSGWSTVINAESIPLREQVRRILPNRYGYDAVNKASYLVQFVRRYTSQSVKIDIFKSFICLECNKAIEEAKPWQWEHRPIPDSDGGNNWAHRLVLINRDQAPAAQTLEERFTQENAKLHDRLTDIETLLSGIRPALVKQ